MKRTRDQELLEAFLGRDIADEHGKASEEAFSPGSVNAGERKAIEAARRLAEILAASRTIPDEADETLAFLAATRAGLPLGSEEVFDTAVRALIAAADRSDELSRRWDRLCADMERLDRSSSASSHFQRLTGFPAEPGDRLREPRTSATRPARARSATVIRLVTWSAAAAVVLVSLASVAGRLTEDSLARAVHASLRVRSLERGPQPSDRLLPETDPTAVLSGWVRRAAGARSMRFGLWPVYDKRELGSLEQEILETGDSSAVSLLVLGEIRLMGGDVGEATTALRNARDRGSVEASRWLARIAGGAD